MRRIGILVIGGGAVLGSGALAGGCDPNVAGYCAPGTIECAVRDGGSVRDGTTVDTSAGDEEIVVSRPDGQAVDGGADGADAADGFVCDPSKTPSEEACVVSDALGVFASPNGSDANPGTKLLPLATIGHAMDVAKAAGKRVYACGGQFGETLTVGATRDGVKVYGGLDCTSWSYGVTNRVVVARPGSLTGYALSITGLVSGVTFEDIEFDAHDANATNAGESSVAVFVGGAQSAVFMRVTMVAGSGAGGAAGAAAGPNPDGGVTADPSNWFGTAPNYAELNGATAMGTSGAMSTVCTCRDHSTSTGGQGGGAAPLGQLPGPGLPSYGVDGGGSAGTNGASCGSGGTAMDGANAPATAADTAVTALGALTSNGWTPAVGTSGSDGNPGQGGGGGGNGSLTTGGGGGGACGGCGGAGGKPGTGGGASVALLSYQSEVVLSSCTLSAHAAGNGGSGGGGEPGEVGGGSGTGFPTGASKGCSGGNGAAGSGGNGGQGGSGGLSLGIGYAGTAPTVDGVVVPSAGELAGVTVSAANASGGMGGAGGTATGTTAGAGGAAGPAGVSQAVRSL